MRAVIIEAGKVSVAEVPVPELLPGYCLIQTLVAGICNTDLELQRGYYNFRGIPGHEFVGRVVRDDSSTLLGHRVAGEINLRCGHCSFCARYEGNHCPNRTVLGILNHPGAFAEYLTLPAENLHVLPESISDREAVFAEPLAAAWHISEQVPIQQGQRVAVLGDGKLGLLAAQAMKAAGAAVTLFGRHERKLDLAREWGILIGSSDNAKKFPVVIECTGSTAGLEQAVNMTEPLGKLVMKSTVHEDVTIAMAAIIVNEITLIGSRCGRFAPAIELLQDKKVLVEKMIDEEYSLDQAPEAFSRAAERGTLKVILKLGNEETPLRATR